jgi:hypothetical protein
MATTDLSESRALNAEGCLFCRRHDGGFVSREHVFSEALGNTDDADGTMILEPGIVCDRCNNGPLGAGDEALVTFAPIAMLRAERGLGSKAGKAPVAKFGNAHVWWSEGRTMNVAGPGGKAMNVKQRPDGRIEGKLELTSGGPLTAKRLRLIVRSVWKSAVELFYLDHGPQAAFAQTLDGVRDAILDDDAAGWALVPMNAKHHQSLQLHYVYPAERDGHPIFPVGVDIFGLVIVTDLLVRDAPYTEPLENTNVWQF